MFFLASSLVSEIGSIIMSMIIPNTAIAIKAVTIKAPKPESIFFKTVDWIFTFSTTQGIPIVTKHMKEVS